MKHVIDLDTDTVIELRLPSAAGVVDEPPPSLLLRLVPLDPEADADTAGFIQNVSEFVPRPIVPQSLSGLTRLVIVCDQRPGPPPVELPGQDVRGFMMKEMDPDNRGKGYESPGGAPIGLAFEWLGDPQGTFIKYFFGS
ncbi:MAG: hypothetical protein ACRDJE_19355 [Dehalococcoidia bacterium]